MVANLCIEAAKRGIAYITSLHDHHAFYHGKDSFVYQQQLEAIKKSVFSIAHGEYVVDYFNETDKLFFLPHGVDTSYFTVTQEREINLNNAKLLMVSNNGMASNFLIDRKNFRIAIEAAKALDLSITIVGTDANNKFFEGNEDLLEYDKLTVIADNPPQDTLLELYHTHDLFIHPSSLEFGVPCLAQLEAASCCIPIIGTMKGVGSMVGLYKIDDTNITSEQVAEGIRYCIEKYPYVKDAMVKYRHNWDWSKVCERLERMYKAVQPQKYDSASVREQYLKTFN